MNPPTPGKAHGQLPAVQVSRQSAGFILRGHPWVRPDRFTRGLERVAAGDQITLVDERGKRLASALVDPASELCARVYDRNPDQPLDVPARMEAAWRRRAKLHVDAATTCYRVVHGEGDGLPGLRIERYADVLVVLLTARLALGLVQPVCAWLAAKMPKATIIVREHFDDLRRVTAVAHRFDGKELDPNLRVVGSELGVQVEVYPAAHLATGIYVDQRATRAWLRERCAGKRILNLFSYTGLFSISLLAAGAASALDVDMAAPCLATATTNAALNKLGAKHQVQQANVMTFLKHHEPTYDLVICDPPTASQNAKESRGWVARRDYPLILPSVIARVAPGGMLVACLNALGGKPYGLQAAVLDAAKGALRAITPPELAEDIPQVPGFPEGRPYQLVICQRVR